jgi:hypothetical protein
VVERGLSGRLYFTTIAVAAQPRILAIIPAIKNGGGNAEFATSATRPDRRSTTAGVLIVPQTMPVTHVVDELILIWAATEAEEWRNRIYSLPL